MDVTRRYHSVRLNKDLCMGCTNCLMHCPTEAIRVRGGRAHIIDELCIDCGECIRMCPYHAKVAITDSLEDIHSFKYSIALPAPSLYGQFRNLKTPGLVIAALKKLGFDDVFEVARGADIVSRAICEKLRDPSIPKPLISSACPVVERLIQVRFPDLLPNLVDIRPPVEVAAMVARREFCEKKGCAPEDVGVFFITPCPAKMTAIRSPLTLHHSSMDGAISMMEIYGKLLPLLSHRDQDTSDATSYGIAWAVAGGEASAVCPDNSLTVDGIQSVIRVLEEIENENLSDLVFFEGNACRGGCVGGPLTFENNFVAKNTIRKLRNEVRAQNADHPTQSVPHKTMVQYPLKEEFPLEPNKAMQLGEDIETAARRMTEVNEIVQRLPGYDCGSCGSPTCRTFAEDIVRGFCTENDCIYKLRDQLKVMAQQMIDLTQTTRK